MAQKYPSNWKHCATCVYWTGHRDVDFFGQWVSVDSTQTKGRCMCRCGGWSRQETPASLNCSAYLKWPALS